MCYRGISQFYLHNHTFTRNRNEPYLPLPSQPQLALIYRPRRDERLSRPWCEVAPAEIAICNLPIANPALYHTATSVLRNARVVSSVRMSCNHVYPHPQQMADNKIASLICGLKGLLELIVSVRWRGSPIPQPLISRTPSCKVTHTVVGVVRLCCHGFGRYYRVVRWLQLRFPFDSTAVRLPFYRGTTIRRPAL